MVRKLALFRPEYTHTHETLIIKSKLNIIKSQGNFGFIDSLSYIENKSHPQKCFKSIFIRNN